MKLSEFKALTERWTPELKRRGQEALMGKNNSPFPLTGEELTDLRGLGIVEIIENVTIKSFDMSGVKLEGFGQFAMCNVHHSKFSAASLGTNIGGNFFGCDFSLVKANGAGLRGEFVECKFFKTNLSRAMGRYIKFIRCNFHKAKFNSSTLLYCYFEDCHFEECTFQNSSLSYSTFVRSPLDDVSIGNALMKKVKFLDDY